MSDIDQKLLDNLLSSNIRKEEIFQLDEFINRYQSDDKYDNALYTDIFNNLLHTKLLCTNDM